MTTTTRKSWFEMLVEEEEEEHKKDENLRIKIKQEPMEKDEDINVDVNNPGSCEKDITSNINQKVKSDKNSDDEEKYISCGVKVKQEIETNYGCVKQSDESNRTSIGRNSDIKEENEELKRSIIDNDIKVKSEKLCAEDVAADVKFHTCVTESLNANEIKTFDCVVKNDILLNSENISSVGKEKSSENSKFLPSQESSENLNGHVKDIHMSTPKKNRTGRKRHRSFPDKNEHRDGSSNQSDSNDPSSISSSPSKPKRKVEYEEDPVVLARRQKQIDYGKNTIGYDRYRQQIPRDKRTVKHPRTPPKHLKYSRRAWDGIVKVWRQQLHFWDPVTDEDYNSLGSLNVSLDSDQSPRSKKLKSKLKLSSSESSSIEDVQKAANTSV